MRSRDLGLVPYKEAEALQYQLVEDVAAGAEDIILLLEHPPVITFGRNGGEEFLLGREADLQSRGVELVKSTRGGKITCHYPGQLVLYPIINLTRWNKAPCPLEQRGLRGFYWGMEEAVILALAHFGLQTGRREGFPGVWVERRKICSIGTAVRHSTTYHGLALNVAADTSLFNSITLCGLPDAVPTSLCGELGREITVQEVKNVLEKQFLRLFSDYAG